MTKLSSAWLVKFEYRAVKMRAFTSYDKAVTYYNEMVQNIDEQIEESYYETKNNIHRWPQTTSNTIYILEWRPYFPQYTWLCINKRNWIGGKLEWQ